MDRVIAYIDGFNLYFGLKDSGLKNCYWLNIQSLAQKFLKPQQQLDYVKYFTAKIKQPSDKSQRQHLYLQAIETLSDTSIYYGRYMQNEKTCRLCGGKYFVNSEKMTDVNMAVEMMTDAMQDKFDTAFLISGDGDLTGPVRAIQNLFPSKKVFVMFPPKRFSHDLSKVASAFATIGERRIAKSLFPKQIILPNGYKIDSPPRWFSTIIPTPAP